MPSAVITVKVPKKLKEDARRYGIRLGPVLRTALAEKVREAQLSELRKALDEAGQILRDAGVTSQDIVTAVRAGREER